MCYPEKSDLFDQNFDVFLIEYRGYGNSNGTPSEKGFIHDGETALKYLHNRQDVDSSQIVVFGRSLGGKLPLKFSNTENNVEPE